MQTRSMTFAGRGLGEWFSSLPTVVILLLTIFLASGEIIHSQLLKVGESSWEGYFQLRAVSHMPEPTCNRDPDIEAAVARAVASKQQELAEDPLAALLGGDVDEQAIRSSIERSVENCRNSWSGYEKTKARITPGVVIYSTFEAGVASVVTLVGNYKRLLLCLLIIIAAATTTLGRHHIALRPITSIRDYYVGTIVMLSANLLLLMSASVYRYQEQVSMSQGVQVHDFYLHIFWILGFGLLSIVNIFQLIKPPKNLPQGGKIGKAFLTVPIYAYMTLGAAIQFIIQGYYHGISVYLGMMMELSTMFLNLALYIWIGMMLKQTRLAHLACDILRPWKMSPELMCVVVLALAAFPTAYTGASGIFIIAAGALIYMELSRAGARPQLALASAAMSGAMGVVLRPCLLIVIIAALNNSVTTNELFTSGFKIYFLTVILFFLFAQLYRTEPARVAPFSEAIPQSVRNMAPLVPYIIIMMTVVVLFRDLLDRKLDEFSAPIILPIMMLAVLLYEKLSRKALGFFMAVAMVLLLASYYRLGMNAFGLSPVMGLSPIDDAIFSGTLVRNLILTALMAVVFSTDTTAPYDQEHEESPEVGHTLESSIRLATNQTTSHIGALLLLMALSVSTGGIIERSGLMEALPETFSSVWIAAGVLVITMVCIGMIMDPYGAVILVNATIAPIAMANGLDPLHFWMITLVSFELGYLTPPIALNHLLARQVIGDHVIEAAKIPKGQASFWRRHEKYILPILVMFTALIIVAFLPLASSAIHEWAFAKLGTGF